MRDIEEYSKKALEVKLYEQIENIPHNLAILSYLVMSLSEEASEVGGKLKRIIRDEGGQISEENRLLLKKELGDCLWCVCSIADWLGMSMEDIMDTNLEKIQDRILRNKLQGSGDDR
jgi:NTP pyrophosphatase (non-canonical NTP hydrolase)